MRIEDVLRLELGTFVRPAEETGTGSARVETVLGYVARTPAGLLLFDTGLGEAGDDTEAWYRPRRIEDRGRPSQGGARDRRHRPGGQLPPALRPHRREPVLGWPPHLLPTRRARHRAHDRLHGPPAGRLRRCTLRAARRRGADRGRRTRHPDAGPRRRAPVGGVRVRRRLDRPRRSVPRHRIRTGRRTLSPRGLTPSVTSSPCHRRVRGCPGCWSSTPGGSSSPTTPRSGSRDRGTRARDGRARPTPRLSPPWLRRSRRPAPRCRAGTSPPTSTPPARRRRSRTRRTRTRG